MGTLPNWMMSDAQRQAAQPVDYDIATSFHNAPGWRLAAEDFYTCVPPADRPINPVVLRAIHEFDPGLIPIWRKQLYLPPGEQNPVMVTHHGIARHVKDPKGARRLFHVEMPRNAKHPTPNLLEAILEQEDEVMMHEGGPGKFQRFDMWLYRMLRKQYNVSKSPKEIVAGIMKKRDEEKERARRARAVEDEYRQKRMDKLMAQYAGRITRADEREYWRRMRNRPTRPSVYVKGAV
jgi:hypothetical protein